MGKLTPDEEKELEQELEEFPYPLHAIEDLFARIEKLEARLKNVEKFVGLPVPEETKQ